AEGQVDRLPVLAAELVALPVDVIVTVGGFSAEAARDATSSIPIVMVYPQDPVAMGLVASFARPGGNITGLSANLPLLASKQLELLKEAVPGVSRIAVVRDPDIVLYSLPEGVPSAPEAARTMGVQMQLVPVREPGDLATAFEAASRTGAEA